MQERVGDKHLHFTLYSVNRTAIRIGLDIVFGLQSCGCLILTARGFSLTSRSPKVSPQADRDGRRQDTTATQIPEFPRSSLQAFQMPRVCDTDSSIGETRKKETKGQLC